MDGWILIPALILLTISAIGVFRHWRNLPEYRLAQESWFVDTTADLALKDEPAAPSRRDIQREEREFHRRQFRRRLQGSLMIGALGLLLPVGPLIHDPVLNLIYVAVLLSLLAWMLLLGIADLVATRHHFSRVREQLMADMLAGIKPDSNADATLSQITEAITEDNKVKTPKPPASQ